MQALGRLQGHLAALFAVSTAAIIPWMLGGVVPLARVVLLIGAITAGVLSVLSQLSTRKVSPSLPIILLPLIALALLGICQLRPKSEHPVNRLHHTQLDPPSGMVFGDQAAASFLPAETRSMVATLLAAAVLCFVAFNHLQSKRALTWASVVFGANAFAMTVIGFTQLFHRNDFSLNEIWSLGGKDPFATFVNPNNAAGWLCLGFSLAAGWLAFQLRASSTDERIRVGKLRIPIWERIWQASIRFLADLSIWQILAFVTVALLGAGVCATRSRGGILALLVGVVLTLVARSSLRKLPLVALVLAAVGTGTYALLTTLDLDREIFVEMETLRDLDEAAGSRPRHWADSLHVLLDAPLTGTGLGSYRSATLPYQSQPTNLWFKNADNHFVDMIVEGGLVGFVLFVSIGFCGLATGVAGWKQSRKRIVAPTSDVPRISRRLLSAVGTALVLATLTQAVSGFFDYGVGMPAAIALSVVIVSAGAGLFHSTEPESRISRTGAVSCGRTVVVCVQLCLLSAAAAFIPDQWAAADVDPVIVAGTNLLASPVTLDKLYQIPKERSLLEERLRSRPDDPDGWRMLWQLASAEFRWNLLASQDQALREDRVLGARWRELSMFWLAQQVARTSVLDPASAARTRADLAVALKETGLQEVLEELQKRFPLMPNVATARAEIAVIIGDDKLFKQQIDQATFVEPANAEVTFRLGLLALSLQKTEMAEKLWKTCLAQSDHLRSSILIEARRTWSDDEVMKLFGPTTYVECVQAAQHCRDRELRGRLYEQAESNWPDVSDLENAKVESLRASHLAATGRPEEAIEWLERCVRRTGDRDRIPLRKQLAALQEKQGHFADALQQWTSIQTLNPRDADAAPAITRLRTMK